MPIYRKPKEGETGGLNAEEIIRQTLEHPNEGYSWFKNEEKRLLKELEKAKAAEAEEKNHG